MEDNKPLKKAPYGLASYPVLIENNFIYVDKTRYIEVLENSATLYPFIVRPRRFGKTLFTSILQFYYDKASASDFNKYFANTYIGKHKTLLANTYYVLRLEFSGIDPQNFLQGFIRKIRQGLVNFQKRYPFDDGLKILQEKFTDPSDLLGQYLDAFSLKFDGRIYLIIDEYDQSANEVLSDSVESFRSLTSKGGILKTFYSNLKDRTFDIIERIFITGVTSISLDSMTSGFSIASNLTTSPKFAALFSFTHEELQKIIPQLINLKKSVITKDEILCQLKEWYNGYRFSPNSDSTVYNASNCIYYLSTLAAENKIPDIMIDPAFAQDQIKIRNILNLGDTDFVYEIINKALRNKPIAFDCIEPQTINLNKKDRLDNVGVLSAMYYLGFLTYAKGQGNALIIPNRSVRIQFFEYYANSILGTKEWKYTPIIYQNAYKAMANGDPKPFLQTITERLSKKSGLRSALTFKENNLQTLIAGSFFTDAFIVDLEYEVRGTAKGAIDVLIRPATKDAGQYSYILELKYLPQKKASTEAIKNALQNAMFQASRYANGDNIRDIPNLKCVAAIFVGLELKAYDIL